MDDLTKLKGVGEATAAMLIAAGVTSIAALAAADAEALIKTGGFKASHDVADWIAQAKVIVAGSNGGEAHQAWRGHAVSVVLKQDQEGVGVAGEIVTLPDLDAAELRRAGKARRLLVSDLSKA